MHSHWNALRSFGLIEERDLARDRLGRVKTTWFSFA